MADKKMQDVSQRLEELEKVSASTDFRIQQLESSTTCSKQGHLDLSNSVLDLKGNVSGLSIKFETWQSTIKHVLSTAQTSVNHSTYILAVLGVVLALAIIWVTKNKMEAIRDARDDLVKDVMNSPKFQKVLRETIAYKMESQSAEESRAFRNSSQFVALSNINSAEKKSPEENREYNSKIYDKTYNSE